eukprot:5613672-Alexandrium_andersonii.AAC.1
MRQDARTLPRDRHNAPGHRPKPSSVRFAGPCSSLLRGAVPEAFGDSGEVMGQVLADGHQEPMAGHPCPSSHPPAADGFRRDGPPVDGDEQGCH